MSLSINPVSHDQAMNRQLGYVQVEGMSAEGLEDTRNLIRKMCSYTRDYRPSSLDVARELEQLVHRIEPANRVTLPEFSRTTVVPIYESRPRLAPEEVLSSNSESEFLKEVTGALTSNKGATGGGLRSQYMPYVFVGALAFVVMLLGSFAAVKFLTDQGSLSAGDDLATVGSAAKGLVRVKVWIPSDAQAQVGEAFLPTAGHVRVPSGETDMKLFFNNGRTLDCSFVAEDGSSVRAVVDRGTYGLSVDDGDVGGCAESTPPRSGEGGAG